MELPSGKSLNESFSKLNPYVQWAIIIIALVLIIIFIRRTFGKIKGAFETLDAKAEQSKFPNEKLSYPKSQYEDLADKLYNAMDGIGTYDDDVMEVFDALQNNVDYLELKAQFGEREGYSMIEWLNSDMDSGEIEEINGKLQSKGIQYRI